MDMHIRVLKNPELHAFREKDSLAIDLITWYQKFYRFRFEWIYFIERYIWKKNITLYIKLNEFICHDSYLTFEHNNENWNCAVCFHQLKYDNVWTLVSICGQLSHVEYIEACELHINKAGLIGKCPWCREKYHPMTS